MNDEELQDKFRGAMLGGAIGDALGSPFAGWEDVSRKTFESREDDPGRMSYTDETHMTIGVAESLVDCQSLVSDHMARVLLRNYDEEPWRRYSPRLVQLFNLLRQGTGWEEAARRITGINGAAGRIVPAALFGHDDPAQVVRLARQIGAITDPNGWTLESAVLLAPAVALLLPIPPLKRLNKASYLRSLREYVGDSTALRVLGCIEALLPDSSPERVKEHLRQTITPPYSVPVALYAFLRCPESFHETLYFALSVGGDTDTTGAIAGALAGAFLGAQLIPPVWRREVEGSQLMRRLADSLLLVSALNEDAGATPQVTDCRI